MRLPRLHVSSSHCAAWIGCLFCSHWELVGCFIFLSLMAFVLPFHAKIIPNRCDCLGQAHPRATWTVHAFLSAYHSTVSCSFSRSISFAGYKIQFLSCVSNALFYSGWHVSVFAHSEYLSMIDNLFWLNHSMYGIRLRREFTTVQVENLLVFDLSTGGTIHDLVSNYNDFVWYIQPTNNDSSAGKRDKRLRQTTWFSATDYPDTRFQFITNTPRGQN